MSLDNAPAFSVVDAADVARELYGIDATATPLPSERDQNFRMDPIGIPGTVEVSPESSSTSFVLKIANATEGRDVLEAQNAALAHVASRLSFCPRVIPTRDGSDIAEHLGHLIRVVTWLPGVPLGSVRHHSTAMLQDLGRKVAQLDLALQSFEHPAVHRTLPWDPARAFGTIREHLSRVEDRDMRHLVERTAGAIGAGGSGRFEQLPRSTIHADANDYNVLVSGGALDGPQQVTGLIDFGDLLHSYTIADLAIAIAYAVLGKRRPLDAASAIVLGYHGDRRIGSDELAALYPMVLLRMCLSVCLAAVQQPLRPGDAYLGISQQPIRDSLPRLASIAFDEAEAAFRAACDAADALAARRSSIGANVSVAYETPVRLVRGSMQYLFDDRGRRYLDGYNNVPHVGHAHPRVVAAVSEQLGILNTNTRYLNDRLAEFGDRLTATLPGALRVCYFVNSGSEANELALRLARAHTRQGDLIVLESAYHGNTTTLVDISHYKFSGPGGGGRASWVHVVPLPDVYRGAHQADDPQAGIRYAEAVAAVIGELEGRGTGLCGFIAETCPSVAGQIILPSGYLSAVYAHVRGAGGVCIADEVQTAYGRMGTSFYAFEDHDVVPDIVVLGKPIGNGYPLGAVVTTEEIAASFDNGMEFFSTFGGSTASCAAGLAVLEVVRDEQLQEHARIVGDRLIGALRALCGRHALIGDVRGSGFFIGVDLVRDRDTREPAPREASFVVNRMRDEGVLLGTDGPFHNVLKIRPPMPFNAADGDQLIALLDGVLGEL
jgi:4-aminobutyrate aminotransferase-like enzyme/Ser/Thr protein kinase RdoA (MazF antagonist)